jgi:hypothetical protein
MVPCFADPTTLYAGEQLPTVGGKVGRRSSALHSFAGGRPRSVSCTTLEGTYKLSCQVRGYNSFTCFWAPDQPNPIYLLVKPRGWEHALCISHQNNTSNTRHPSNTYQHQHVCERRISQPGRAASARLAGLPLPGLTMS